MNMPCVYLDKILILHSDANITVVQRLYDD